MLLWHRAMQRVMINLRVPSELCRPEKVYCFSRHIPDQLYRGQQVNSLQVSILQTMRCEITAFRPTHMPLLACQLGPKRRNMGGWGRMLLTGEELSFPFGSSRPPSPPPELSGTAGRSLLLSAKLYSWPPRHIFESVEMFFQYNATLSQGENAHNRGFRRAQHRGGGCFQINFSP